jgi:hypothetical protein
MFDILVIRLCGGVFCGNHCSKKVFVAAVYDEHPQRVCDMCHDRVKGRHNMIEEAKRASKRESSITTPAAVSKLANKSANLRSGI